MWKGGRNPNPPMSNREDRHHTTTKIQSNHTTIKIRLPPHNNQNTTDTTQAPKYDRHHTTNKI